MSTKELAIRIGKQINRKAIERKLSQKELAYKAGLTESGLCRYIKGQRLPRIDILIRIAIALNCSIDYLIFGIDG